MTFGNFVKKGLLVALLFGVLWWLGQNIFIVDGKIDWFRFMLVYGVPVGIPHMYFVIPLHCDVGSGVAMLVLCILLGALCGCFIAAGMAVRAVYYIIGYPLYCLRKKVLY